jgi:Zn-finger nucleic acid-binding protein
MDEQDVICPACKIAVPEDSRSSINTSLCKMCLAELTRKVREQTLRGKI